MKHLSITNLNDHVLSFNDVNGELVNISPMGAATVESSQEHYDNVVSKLYKISVSELPSWMAGVTDVVEPSAMLDLLAPVATVPAATVPPVEYVTTTLDNVASTDDLLESEDDEDDEDWDSDDEDMELYDDFQDDGKSPDEVKG